MASTMATRSKASHEDSEAYTNEKRSAISCTQHWEDSVHSEKGQELYRKFKEADRKASTSDKADGSSSGQSDEAHQPKKRGLGANQKGSNKKAKNGNSGSEGQPKGIAGDKTRVPSKGQEVQWHALPGWVDGEVVEVVFEEKTVDGEKVKASNEDPRIVLKSSSSGKIAVHKPEDVYFD